MSVIEVDVLAFFETRTTELSKVSTRLSSSFKAERFLGRSLDNSKNSLDCISFTCCAGISWNGAACWASDRLDVSCGVTRSTDGAVWLEVGADGEEFGCKTWTAARAASLAISLEAAETASWTNRRMTFNCPSVKLLSFALALTTLSWGPARVSYR